MDHTICDDSHIKCDSFRSERVHLFRSPKSSSTAFGIRSYWKVHYLLTNLLLVQLAYVWVLLQSK
jgi:hypothetical protein